LMTEKIKNILYLGKDEKFAHSLKRMMQLYRQDFRLHVNTSLNQLPQTLEGKLYDAILFDTQFLSDDGQALLHQIYRLAAKFPVIFIVDKDNETVGRQAMENGVFDYLIKVDGVLTALPFTVERALEHRPTSLQLSTVSQEDEKVEPETGFFEINEHGRIIFFDDNFEKMLGLSHRELYQSYISDFISEEDRDFYYRWQTEQSPGNKEGFYLRTQIIHPEKGVVPVELRLSPYEQGTGLFSGYRGILRIVQPAQHEKVAKETLPNLDFFEELYELNKHLRKGLSQLFLMKLTEIPKKYFGFKTASLYLYDPLANNYRKEITLSEEETNADHLSVDFFTGEAIKSLFAQNQFTQFAHQSLFSDVERAKLLGSKEKGLFEKLQWQEGKAWNKGDRLFLNLKGTNDQIFGFIVLENPASGTIPSSAILQQAKLYIIFASSLFEGFDRYSVIEKKHRRLKQIFTLFGAYSLELPLENLLREIVWLVKFSFGYRLVILGILTRSTRRLELKAVAIEDKEKAQVLKRLHFSIGQIANYMREQFRISRSYFITQKQNVFYLIKRIYGLPVSNYKQQKRWYYEDVLLVPLYSSKNKIIGFFIIDDPEDHSKPDLEIIQMLEKIAQMVAVHVENKVVFTQLQQYYLKLQKNNRNNGQLDAQKNSKGGIRNILKIINL